MVRLCRKAIFPSASPRNSARKCRTICGASWNRYGRQFPFPESLSPALYLNAAQASAEVLTLPLGEHISPKDVETISRKVVGACNEQTDMLRVAGEAIFNECAVARIGNPCNARRR